MAGWQLPEGWEWRKIGDICNTTSGGTPSRKRSDYFEGTIPWVKSGELPDGYISEVEEFITDEAIQNSNAKVFPRGTLLVAMYGATVGKLGILEMDAATNQAVCAVFQPPQIERDFLFWYLKSIRNQLLGISFGAAQPNISQTVIKNTHFPLPYPDQPDRSLVEQRRIVAQLEALLGEVREMRKLNSEISADVDILMDSVRAERFYRNANLPEGWEMRRIDSLAEVNPRRPRLKREDEKLTSFVPMAAVDEVRGEFTRVEPRPYHEVKRGYTYFEEDDVVFAKITPSMQNGKSAVARNLIDGFGFGTTEFHVIRSNGRVLPDWIHQFVRQGSFLSEAMGYFRGAVGQQREPSEFLESYEIPVPFPDNRDKSLAVQRQIINHVRSVQSEIWQMRDDAEAEKVLLEDFEGAVLIQAFQGEL